MRKIVLNGVIAIGLGIGFTGCASSMAGVMENVNTALDEGLNTAKKITEDPATLFSSKDDKNKTNETEESQDLKINDNINSLSLLTKLPKKDLVINTNNNVYIDNGALVFNNGEKLYDEEGDIKDLFILNNQVFYILQNLNKNIISIKDLEQNIIKTFTGGIMWFKSNDEFIIASKLKNNASLRMYDNIYSFNGKKFKLINKNLNLSGNKTGFFVVKSLYNKYGFKGTTVTNIKNSKQLNNRHLIIGASKDKILYIERVSTGFLSKASILKVLDTNTDKSIPLLKEGEEYLQFYKLGNEIILKIMSGDTLSSESKMHGHYTNVKSKFTNKKGRYIHLNTLTEVDGVSKDFKLIPLYTGFSNMGGGYTRTTHITYTLQRLSSYIYANRSSNKRYIPMF